MKTCMIILFIFLFFNRIFLLIVNAHLMRAHGRNHLRYLLIDPLAALETKNHVFHSKVLGCLFLYSMLSCFEEKKQLRDYL